MGILDSVAKKLDAVPFWFRKWLVGILGVIIFGGGIALLFLYFYISSRLSYPERNVLYRVNESVKYASSSQKYHLDRESFANISEGSLLSSAGGGTESVSTSAAAAAPVKAIMCTSKRREKGDVDEYELLNMSYQKVAQASTKSEKSRAVFDISRQNYIQNVASFVNQSTNKEDIKVVTLERAAEIASFAEADTYVVPENAHVPVHRYRLTDGRRYWGLFGERFRSSTKLQRVIDEKAQKFETVYHSKETGWIGMMPQGSSYYLFRDVPTFGEKLGGYFGRQAPVGSDEITFNIVQFWNAFPWRTMNGGYTISDSAGELAMVRIEDFWFNYDEDVVYWYYFDLDGDGKLNLETECVGRVLFSPTGAQAVSEAENKGGDISTTNNYSFMAGSNLKTALADFILCGDIEAMMPDQIFDGFGQHSYLGYIEEKRDDIMFYLDRSVENLDRAIKEEDTIGTARSIARLLASARRPYAEKARAKLGVSADDVRNPAR